MRKADRKGAGNRQNVVIKKEEVVEGAVTAAPGRSPTPISSPR